MRPGVNREILILRPGANRDIKRDYMTDSVIAKIARRLAESLAANGYERTTETKTDVALRAMELVAAVRAETEAETHEKVQAETPQNYDLAPGSA